MDILTLGIITFNDFEVPSVIPFGGQQTLARHQLMGGGRTLQPMGDDDMDLAWEGTFLGEKAYARARILNEMRRGGLLYTLTWHEFSYDVVIAEFVANYEAFYRIPYRISCAVVQDSTAEVPSGDASIDACVRSDLSDLDTDADALDSIDSLSAPISAANAALQQVASTINNFTTATAASVAPVIAAASTARALIQSAQNVASSSMGALASIVNLVPGTQGLQNTLLDASNAAQRVPVLNRMDVTTTRLITNLGLAGVETQSVARTVSGTGTLFDLAAQQYGDPTQWQRIAQASGRIDPMLPGMARINIPQ